MGTQRSPLSLSGNSAEMCIDCACWREKMSLIDNVTSLGPTSGGFWKSLEKSGVCICDQQGWGASYGTYQKKILLRIFFIIIIFSQALCCAMLFLIQHHAMSKMCGGANQYFAMGITRTSGPIYGQGIGKLFNGLYIYLSLGGPVWTEALSSSPSRSYCAQKKNLNVLKSLCSFCSVQHRPMMHAFFIRIFLNSWKYRLKGPIYFERPCHVTHNRLCGCRLPKFHQDEQHLD